jgi:uncharacterized protein (TIGR03435 family)
MQLTGGSVDVCAALRSSAITFAAALFGAIPLLGLPDKGTPAPPVDSLQLLQAPTGAKADWGSLKGKIVILDFWATWCSPCVASLPHLNQLVGSLDPAKFQFISVDDEDLTAVESFLAKKKMSGWVGVDATGSVLAWYGIKSRPTTVIVDGNGKIAAVTEIDSVSADELQAVAEGKSAMFKPVMEIATSSGSSSAGSPSNALFAISLSKAATAAKQSQINHSPTGTDYLGTGADSLFTSAFDVFHDRYVLIDPMPEGLYDLRTNFVDVPKSVMDSAVRQAVLSALHLQIQPKTVTKSAYILRATGASKQLLSPSASTRKVKRGSWRGGYLLMNGTMDDLAYVLATGLENPVVNETGIEGNFDARFKIEGRDLDSANAVLRSTLGLELVQGDQETSITVFEVSKQEGSKSASATKPQQ